MNNVNIFALGGLDENGKNCYIFEYNNKIYVINAGTKVPINSKNGVDTLIPNFSYLEKNKDRIAGVFISDVKNETFSALPWLLMHIPDLNIYTSSFNKIMITERLSKYKIMNKNFKIHTISKMTKFNDIFVQPIELAGSMPGHIGFDFITPSGDYLFMFNFVEGDLGIYGKLNFDTLQNAFKKRQLVALVVDSGRANYSGKAVEKINLPDSLRDVFMAANPNERIIIGAYDEEMVAIHQILDMAYETKRPIVTYGKTYWQLFNLMKKEHPELPLPELIDYKSVNKVDNAVVLVTGAIERLYSRFLRITDNNDVFLSLKRTDNVIMIAPPVAGLESIAAVALDDIARITPKISDVTGKEFYRHRPARQDLVDLAKKLKPKYVIPVQGLYRYLSEAAKSISTEAKIKPQNCLLLQNGKVAHFINGKLSSTKGKIKGVGDVIIDGFGIGDISTEVIAEREILGRDGAIIITSTFNPTTKKLTGKLQINMIGSISKDDKKDAEQLIILTLANLIDTEEFDGLKDFQNRSRHVIRKKIFKTFNKEPMIIVSLNQN
ncbi:ribonuclease J [Mycoplasma sp. CSL7475-4]|uniref:MBL fold metallo-hydrolase RNA specificity domain-containing protein n=1 Tax=Mycoplasma sp. CSL7475-4 TaxID=2973942 RepID=UPI00216AC253|nr:ribonuclease J [Mycoplasma sp. CSL7475-4]MCS4536959.1 ribonuclease J [Mycoplasma sp. CSL7475-4]